MKRFEQLKAGYATIEKNNIPGDYSDIIVSGITAEFDILFELVWKTLKEYMVSELGIHAAKTGSPCIILSLANENGLLPPGDWVGMLNDRNDDAHSYSQSQAVMYKSRIEYEYIPMIRELIDRLKELIPEDEHYRQVRFPMQLVEDATESGMPVHKYVDKLMKEKGCSMGELLDLYRE